MGCSPWYSSPIGLERQRGLLTTGDRLSPRFVRPPARLVLRVSGQCLEITAGELEITPVTPRGSLFLFAAERIYSPVTAASRPCAAWLSLSTASP
jgi:hypothetical protein